MRHLLVWMLSSDSHCFFSCFFFLKSQLTTSWYQKISTVCLELPKKYPLLGNLKYFYITVSLSLSVCLQIHGVNDDVSLLLLDTVVKLLDSTIPQLKVLFVSFSSAFGTVNPNNLLYQLSDLQALPTHAGFVDKRPFKRQTTAWVFKWFYIYYNDFKDRAPSGLCSEPHCVFCVH